MNAHVYGNFKHQLILPSIGAQPRRNNSGVISVAPKNKIHVYMFSGVNRTASGALFRNNKN